MQLSRAQDLLQYFINLPSSHTKGVTSRAISDNVRVYEPG